jgi:hypothetical protein
VAGAAALGDRSTSSSSTGRSTPSAPIASRPNTVWPPRPGRRGNAVRRLRRTGGASWSETLRQAKDIGDVRIQACSLSMDLLGIGMTDLDPLVDDVEGVATFWSAAEHGQVLFI